MEKRTLSPDWREVISILWWAAILYGFFMILYPFLIGCGCPLYAEHTCGVKQYLAPMGSIICALLWPMGIHLYRHRETMLVLHALLSMLTVLCSLIQLCFGIIQHYIPMTEEIELLAAFICTIPLFPYIGFLTWIEAGQGFYLFTLIYSLTTAVLSIRQYKKRVLA